MKLKPCPFCGAELVTIPAFSNHLQITFVHLTDPPCVLAGTVVEVPRYASGIGQPEFERAKLWNTRK